MAGDIESAGSRDALAALDELQASMRSRNVDLEQWAREVEAGRRAVGDSAGNREGSSGYESPMRAVSRACGRQLKLLARRRCAGSRLQLKRMAGTADESTGRAARVQTRT